MANTKEYDPEKARKLNMKYRIHLKDYVEKKYKQVDQNWYGASDKDKTYEFGENHILVLKSPSNAVHAYSLWYEYDLSNPEKPIAQGDIFHLIAREKGAEYNPKDLKTVYLPEIVNALGDYTREQLTTTTDKLNKTKTPEYEKKSLTPEELAKKHRMDRINNKNVVVPMMYRLINEVEKSGTLFGTEPKPMPLFFTPQKDKGSLRYKNENSPDANKFYAPGIQYVQAMQDDAVPDKRYVFLKNMNGKFSWFVQGVKPVTVKRVDKDGNETMEPVKGKPYLYVFNPKNKKDKGQNRDGYLTVRYVIPFNQLEVDGIGIAACNYSKTINNEPVADKLIQRFPGCFTDKDPNVTKALREELVKDPVKAFRRAVELHGTVARIQKLPGLYYLQREMIVDYGLRSCGFKGDVLIPEKDKKAMVDFMKQDVIGYSKSVRAENGKGFVRKQQSPCLYFRLSCIVMDKNIDHMRSLARIQEIPVKEEKSVETKRNCFDGISLVMDTPYYDRNKNFYPQGAGNGERKIEGEEAYNLLVDMLTKDKEMYDDEKHRSWDTSRFEVYNEADKKEVRLHLKLKEEQQPMKIVFRPGQLHMNNATRVSEALIALQARQEYDNAYNKNTIDRNYKLYVDQQKFDHPGFEPNESTRNEFIVHERDKFNDKYRSLRNQLSQLTTDENTYLSIHEKVAKDLSRKADTFFYAIPKEASREEILEGFESKNVIRIHIPNTIDKTNPEHYVVELRNQLDPLTRDGEVTRDKEGHAYYFDASPSHRANTERMQITPWLSDKAIKHANDFNERFAVTLNMDGEPISIKGNAGRELLVNQMVADRDSFNTEKEEQLRREADLTPYSIDVTYDGKTLFRETGHYGELKLGNFKSVEEMISSQRPRMTQEELDGFDAMLKAEMVAKKYSEVKGDEDYLRSQDKVPQKEIEEVRKKPMKSLEAAYPEENEHPSRVEVLQRDAMVNHIEAPEAVMTYVATELAKDAKAQKLDNPMKAVTEALKEAYPDKAEMVDKVMKDEKIQKMTKPRGIHRSSSGLSRGSRGD